MSDYEEEGEGDYEQRYESGENSVENSGEESGFENENENSGSENSGDEKAVKLNVDNFKDEMKKAVDKLKKTGKLEADPEAESEDDLEDNLEDNLEEAEKEPINTPMSRMIEWVTAQTAQTAKTENMKRKSVNVMSLEDRMTKLKIDETAAIAKLRNSFNKSDEELMQECYQEEMETRKWAVILWNHVFDSIVKSDNKTETDHIEKTIIKIFKCKSINKHLHNIKIEEVNPLQWIETWKKPIMKGGRGIVVDKSDKLFGYVNGLNAFKEFIATQSRNTKLSSKDVLLPSAGYINVVSKFLSDEQILEPVLKNTGSMVIGVSRKTLDSLDKQIDKIYSDDEIVSIIQDTLKFILLPKEADAIKKKLGDMRRNRKNASFSELLSPDFLDRFAHRNIHGDNLSNLRQSTQVKGRTVSSTLYPPEVTFKKGYTDPYFVQLGVNYEYWVPKVHMISGLPVWKEKEEIHRYNITGKLIYIKPSSIKLNKLKGPEISYIRKFIDFNDYLKAWQETYMIKYKDYQNAIEPFLVQNEQNLINKSFLKKLNGYLVARYRLLKKVKDIRKYFGTLISDHNLKVSGQVSGRVSGRVSDQEIEKLTIYESDETAIVMDSIDVPILEKNLYDLLSSCQKSPELSAVLALLESFYGKIHT